MESLPPNDRLLRELPSGTTISHLLSPFKIHHQWPARRFDSPGWLLWPAGVEVFRPQLLALCQATRRPTAPCPERQSTDALPLTLSTRSIITKSLVPSPSTSFHWHARPGRAPRSIGWSSDLPVAGSSDNEPGSGHDTPSELRPRP